jgi:hypothetical protein
MTWNVADRVSRRPLPVCPPLYVGVKTAFIAIVSMS